MEIISFAIKPSDMETILRTIEEARRPYSVSEKKSKKNNSEYSSFISASIQFGTRNSFNSTNEYFGSNYDDMRRKVGVENLGMTALAIASSRGNVNLVRYFVARGATLESRDANGWTALLHASSNNCIEVVLYLHSQRVDLNAVDNEGNSALHVACMRGFVGMIFVLSAAGADTDVKNKVKVIFSFHIESPHE